VHNDNASAYRTACKNAKTCNYCPMSLHAFERTVLELYTNTHALDQYESNRDAYLAARELSPREARALSSVPDARFREFQRQLHNKGYKIAREMLAGKRSVILLSLHKNYPVLLYGSPIHPRKERLSTGEYKVLHAFARTKEPLSITAVLSKCVQAPDVHARDILHLVLFLVSHDLLKTTVRVPFIL
jgi:hypothetical protein